MLNKKEITAILIITLILGFALSLIKTTKLFLYSSLVIFIVILINVFAKKITSFYLDSKIEISIWEIRRYGFKTKQKLKRPFPAGAFFPILSKIFLVPFANFVWMACLVFDAKPKIYRAAKRHGLYSFSEISENHIGLIAASGIIANLIFALLGYLTGFTDFAKLNIYFAFFNMIPISNLDGNKIYFGNILLWSILAIITLISLGYTFFVI